MEAHSMLVPLTDRENPYAKMMIDLIADQTAFPTSAYPRRRTEPVEAPLSRRQRAGVAAAIGAFAAIAIAVTLGAIRAFQS
jgi:hypothetical protein